MREGKPQFDCSLLIQEAHHGFVFGAKFGFETLASLCLRLEEVDVCGVFLRDPAKQCFSLQGFADRRALSSASMSNKADPSASTNTYSVEPADWDGIIVPKHISFDFLEKMIHQGTSMIGHLALSVASDSDLSKLCGVLRLRSGLLLCVENQPQTCGFLFWGNIQKDALSLETRDMGACLANEMRDHFARECLERKVSAVPLRGGAGKRTKRRAGAESRRLFVAALLECLDKVTLCF